MFDFRRITLLFGKTFLKAQNDDIFYKFLGGMAPLAPPGFAYGSKTSYIQVCTFHDGCKQGIDQQIFNRKSISRKITHSQSWKLQAKLTGEKLKG